MIGSESIKQYKYPAIYRDINSLVILPHELLRPYIANYTFTNPITMPIQQVVLPSVSNTLVYSVNDKGIVSGLRGVNTKPTIIGGFASQFNFMFLIEFHSAGFYPFLKIEQDIFLNNTFSFEDLSRSMNQKIIDSFFISEDIETLIEKLDAIFLSTLDLSAVNSTLSYSMNRIIAERGIILTKALAGEVYYSEKQLNRIFNKHIGTNVKTFSRIVRMKHAIDLIDNQTSLMQLAEITGHFDTAHFVHDFKDIYGITPGEYSSKVSIFYNDPYKLSSYNESE